MLYGFVFSRKSRPCLSRYQKRETAFAVQTPKGDPLSQSFLLSKIKYILRICCEFLCAKSTLLTHPHHYYNTILRQYQEITCISKKFFIVFLSNRRNTSPITNAKKLCLFLAIRLKKTIKTVVYNSAFNSREAYRENAKKSSFVFYSRGVKLKTALAKRLQTAIGWYII